MTGFPELPNSGLALWRLRGLDDSQLWCEVVPGGDELVLIAYETVTGNRILTEPHQDIDTLKRFS